MENTQNEEKKEETKAVVIPMLKEKSAIVELASSIENIKQQFDLFQKLKSILLNQNDYQEIQGKKFIKKSGWRKFSFAFNLSDQIIKEDRKEYGNSFVSEVTCRAIAPNGRFSESTATCSLEEKAHADDKKMKRSTCKGPCDGRKHYSHTEHDIRATAATRAKNRAISDLIGGGEVSAEEVSAGGFEEETEGDPFPTDNPNRVFRKPTPPTGESQYTPVESTAPQSTLSHWKGECTLCGDSVNQAVANYSMKKYRKIICYGCQHTDKQ